MVRGRIETLAGLAAAAHNFASGAAPLWHCAPWSAILYDSSSFVRRTSRIPQPLYDSSTDFTQRLMCGTYQNALYSLPEAARSVVLLSWDPIVVTPGVICVDLYDLRKPLSLVLDLQCAAARVASAAARLDRDERARSPRVVAAPALRIAGSKHPVAAFCRQCACKMWALKATLKAVCR